MKKLIICLAALIAVLSLAACHNPADDFVPQGYKRVSDTAADYRLYVPESWKADLSTGATVAYVSDSDRSSVSFLGFEVDAAVIRGAYVTAGGESEPEETADPGETLETVAPVSGELQEVPDILTIEEYWAYFERDFALTFPDMTYSKKGENRLLSGVAAKTYEYTATVTGLPCRFLQVVAMKNGTVYLFTYTSSAEAYESHLEEVEAILGYLQIK